jgi:hypothetical protein
MRNKNRHVDYVAAFALLLVTFGALLHGLLKCSGS